MSREKIRRTGRRIEWNKEESRRAGPFLPAVEPGVDQTGIIPKWEKAQVVAKRNRSDERTAVEPYDLP